MSDPVTIGGVEWTPRAFSAAEHQRYSELAAENRLDELAAEQQARQGGGSTSTREKVLAADIKAKTKLLTTKYVNAKTNAPKSTLTKEQRVKGYELALEIDDLKERSEAVRSEKLARDLVLQERHLQAQEKTMLEFMHFVLEKDGDAPPYHEWVIAVTDTDLRTVEKLVSEGKLPTGLSALTRRHNAIYQTARELVLKANASGNDSASTPKPQASPVKTGKANRSRASSSPSKRSNSRRTKQPVP